MVTTVLWQQRCYGILMLLVVVVVVVIGRLVRACDSGGDSMTNSKKGRYHDNNGLL